MTTQQKLKEYLKEIEKNNKSGNKINSILQLNPNALNEVKEIDKKISSGKAGKLAGKIIAVKALLAHQERLHLLALAKTLKR